MILVHGNEAGVEQIGAPHVRAIRHLAAPWNVGAKNVWVRISRRAGLHEQRTRP